MSRNGSGTYNKANASVVTGTTISSTAYNGTIDDIATALTNSVAKDGQTPLTGSLDFSGNNANNVAIMYIQTEVTHDGDINNKHAFGTDTQDFRTGGSSRLDISDSGIRLGAANARVTTILDEDDMASDSATSLATQQSIKAYINPNNATSATIAANDKVTFSDTDDTNSFKSDTVQGILDLISSAGDTTAGLIEVAVKSEMESASSTTLAVTPGRAHYHPGVCKAWATIDGTGTVTLLDNYNVSGVTDVAQGQYSVANDNNLANSTYAVSGAVEATVGVGIHGIELTSPPTPSSCAIQTAGTSLADSDYVVYVAHANG